MIGCLRMLGLARCHAQPQQVLLYGRAWRGYGDVQTIGATFMSQFLSRRQFVGSSVAGLAAVSMLDAFTRTSMAADAPASDAPYPRLKKAVKFDMIAIKGSIEEKFDLIKSLGFQ